ncbi:MAG: hypothetical protein E7220_00250, partial [Clostridiales bacterium]|nr:hypothetical protein [Clostridiales bacterium]
SMSTEGLPLGIGYTVEETGHDGYVIESWTDNTGTITKEGTGAVAECTNKKIEGKTHLEATKSINNWGKAKSFTFELTAGTNNAGVDTPMPSDAEDGVAQKTVNKGDTSLTAVFGDMVFEKAGVYNYTIKECEPDGGFDEGTTNKKDGVTYDIDHHDVVVTVTDEDGDGEFEFDIKYDESGSLVITNTYAAEGEAVIVANKVFSNWGAKESFNFTLTPVDGAPMPKVNGVEAAEVTKAATETASANFGTIKYEEADTYEYEIREEVPDTAKNKDGVTWAQATDEQKEAGGFVDKGITYDGKTHTVVVKVEDKNHDGKLTTEVKYDGEVTNAATITNEYDANGEIDLKAQKAIQGRTFQEGDEWTFTVSGPEGAEIPMPEHTSVTVRPKSGELIAVDFGKIEYKLKDAGTAEEPKEYTYTITESGEIDGVKNDTEKTVVVTVIDNGDGTLNITKDPADEDGPTFTNKYTSKGETELEATKDFDDWGAKGSFDFTLTPVGNSPMPKVGGVEAASVTKPATQNVPANFGEIEYTAEDTYEYIIKEEVPNGVDAQHPTKDGITYDTTEHHVFVAVTEHDPKDGKLEVVVTYDPEGDTQVISNRYSAKGTADLEVTKAIEYWGGAESFGFTLTAGDNNAGDGVETPMPKVDGTVDPTAEATKADPVAKFGTITYVKPGVYNYTLTEDIPDDAENADKVKWVDATDDEKAAGGFVKDGITYDSAEHTVTVTVTENDPKNGKLNTAVKYDGETDLSITNTYDAEGSTTIDGIKHMENRDFQQGDEFTFTIAAVDNAPLRVDDTSVTITPTSGNDQTFSFGDISYTLDDLKGEDGKYLEEKSFTYTITEECSDSNITVPDPETVVVTVKDNKDGTLDVTAEYSFKDGKFVNKYDASGELDIEVTKEIENRDFQEGDEWTFTLSAEEADAPLPPAEERSKTITPVNGNLATVEFPTIEFTLAHDKDKTYHYKVTETGTVQGVENDPVDAKTITVEISDNGTGELQIDKTIDGDQIKFVNTYDASGSKKIEGVKTMENRDFQEGDEWSFEVVAIGENADTAPLPKNNPVTITPEEGQTADLDFGDIGFDLSDVGKTYHYEVIETGEIDGVKNDTKVHKFDITVADKPAGQKDGKLIVTKTDIGEGLEFTNTYDAKGEAEIGFTKKLSTGDKPVAGKYTFELRDKDDVKIDEASNDADGKVKFAKLTYGLDDAGETFEYKIVETSPAGPGWTNAEPIDITVTVDEDEDDGKVDGVLGTTVAPDIETAEMVNNYRATGKAELFAIKDLTGRDLEREQFEFKLEKQKADGTYEEIQTVKNGNKADTAKAVFDQIEFEYDPAKKIDETGEHVYRISEIVPDDAENADGVTWANANDSQKSAGGFVKDGITYDSTAQTITLTVTDNEEGKLIVTYDGAEEFGGAVFENAYDAKGLITLEGTKSFKYGDFGGAEFTFSIYKKAEFDEAGAREDRSNASGLTPVATASTAYAEIDEDGVAHFTFDDIEYTLDQLKLDGGVKDEDGNYSKSYEYVVVEDIPETAKPKTIDGKDVFYDKEADIQYDGKIIDFTVDVKDDGKGELKTTKSDEEVTFDFENEKRYTNLYLTKHIDKLIGEDTAEEYVNATIVFRLTYHDPVINDDVTRDVSVMFDKKSVTAKTVEVEKIPIGTTVTVSEVYTSNYGKLDPTKVTMTEVEQGVPFYEVELKNTNTNRRTGGGAINHVAPGEEDNYTIIDRVTEASQMDQRPS